MTRLTVKYVETLVDKINSHSRNWLVFERAGRLWSLTDNHTGIETVGTLGEVYSELFAPQYINCHNRNWV